MVALVPVALNMPEITVSESAKRTEVRIHRSVAPCWDGHGFYSICTFSWRHNEEVFARQALVISFDKIVWC